MVKPSIYLDYAATTPVDPEVVAAMNPYWQINFGNVASQHCFGRAAASAVDTARDTLAQFLGCTAPEIIFTSGATEADNLAVRGIILAAANQPLPHIVTTAIEHPAVLATCGALVQEGLATVTYVPVSKAGVVAVADILAAIKPETVLVSVMLANNEIGTIQPVAAIGRELAALNRTRSQRIYFHTDAVQAAAWQVLNADALGVDLLSLSAHKLYGPKGVGALYVRHGTPLRAIQYGGEQEYGVRSGTVPTPLAVGFGAAVRRLQQPTWREVVERVGKLRDQLQASLLLVIHGTINGGNAERLPNTINMTIPGVAAEQLTALLDLRGIAISAGSACAAGKVTPSHVLAAIGCTPEEIACSIRITLGEHTTAAHLPIVTAELEQAAAQIVKAARL